MVQLRPPWPDSANQNGFSFKKDCVEYAPRKIEFNCTSLTLWFETRAVAQTLTETCGTNTVKQFLL